MAVLYGVFLDMGISTLSDLELVQRVCILFMPQKYQPDLLFLRHIPIRKVHIFTAIQVGCIAFLWIIKAIPYIGMLFPVLLVVLCCVRKAMDYYFSQIELKWLDQLIPKAPKELIKDDLSSSRSSLGSTFSERKNSPQPKNPFGNKIKSITSGLSIKIRKQESDEEQTETSIEGSLQEQATALLPESQESPKKNNPPNIKFFKAFPDRNETKEKDKQTSQTNFALKVISPVLRRFSERNIQEIPIVPKSPPSPIASSTLLTPSALSPSTSICSGGYDLFSKRPSIFSLQSSPAQEAPENFFDQDFSQVLGKSELWREIVGSEEAYERKIKRAPSSRNMDFAGKESHDAAREPTWKKFVFVI